MIAVVPRVLGALFYYAPHTSFARSARQDASLLTEHFHWQIPQTVTALCQQLTSPPDELEQDYAVLFQGIGKMPAPPWGSVYQDPENIVMGQSTLAYRHFLQKHGLECTVEQSEPDDHIGLMLLALASLLEQEKDAAVVELLECHLLPWAPRYFSCLKASATDHHFYQTLAQICEHFFADLTLLLELTINKVALYK